MNKTAITVVLTYGMMLTGCVGSNSGGDSSSQTSSSNSLPVVSSSESSSQVTSDSSLSSSSVISSSSASSLPAQSSSSSSNMLPPIKQEPPYQGTVYIDADIFTPADPNSFTGLIDAGMGMRGIYDSRREPAFVQQQVYLRFNLMTA